MHFLSCKVSVRNLIRVSYGVCFTDNALNAIRIDKG